MSMTKRGKLLLAGIAAVAAPLMLAPAAHGFGLQGLSAAPADNAAGAHSDVSIHIGISEPDADIKDLTIHLPPGLVGDPTGPLQCTQAQFNGDNCPAASQVGTTSSAVDVVLLDPLLVVPLTVNGSVYNMVPQTGEPARFGIVLRPPLSDLLPAVLPKIFLQSPARLRPGDFGLDSVLEDLPNTAAGLQTNIKSFDLTLFGEANGQPFLRNPTSCGTHTVGFDATAYTEEAASGEVTFDTVNCEALPFTPSFGAAIGSPGHTQGPTHPPLTTTVTQPDEQAGVRTVTALLPKDVGADNTWLVDGPHWCSDEDFEQGTCPASSIAGSARAESPLLNEPLQGPVAIVEPAPGGIQLPRLGLDLQGPLHIQLFGSFALGGPTPGNEFRDIPDIPLSDFRLRFDADKLVLSSRSLCTGSVPTFDVAFTGWNDATTNQQVPAEVNGCGGKPTAKLKLRKPNSKRPKLRLDVKAGSEPLTRLKLKVPKRYRLGVGGGVRKLLVDGERPYGFDLVYGGRRLTARGFGPASESLGLRLSKGALKRGRGKGKVFRVKVTDDEGQTHAFKLRP
jgi:hypothetical protein